MTKIKNLFNKKWFYVSIFSISVLLNILFGFTNFTPSYLPVSKRIAVSSDAPYDTTDTLYLAHGVVAFNEKEKQPKTTLQIMTFYMDKTTQKVYTDESYLMDNVIGFTSREEMETVSFDKNTGLITLKGNGWEKVIIDIGKKKAVQLTDTTGDVVTLKSSWEIQ